MKFEWEKLDLTARIQLTSLIAYKKTQIDIDNILTEIYGLLINFR
jgi:uncharacterized protein YaaR (DUF327 family)